MATAIGMATINTVFLAFLTEGEHILETASVYRPTRVVMEKAFIRFGLNSTINITDIQKAAEIAHKNDILLVVDNTFSSPYL